MRRATTLAALIAALVLVPAGSAFADHVPTNAVPRRGLTSAPSLLTEGDIRWVANMDVAHSIAAPLGDGMPVERDGRKYMISASSMYGLHVTDVTDPLKPVWVSDYASIAGCPTGVPAFVAARSPGALTGGTPTAIFGVGANAALGTIGYEQDLALTPDGMIAVLGTDAGGRCHDPAAGGIEFIDLTDLRNPRTLHLVRNVGDSHSVTVDPVNPGLAWVSSSDSADFVEIVDFRSCLGGVAAIASCRPSVARTNFDVATWPQIKHPLNPDADLVTRGCHDIDFRGDRAYCAAINATLILDTSKLLGPDGKLTGTRLTEGEHACPTIDATMAPGVKVTDCYGWSKAAFTARGGTSANLRLVSFIKHDATKPDTQDIEIAHQAETIENGTILMITDERGGGADHTTCPGGGIWFYDIRDEAEPTLMRLPDGSPAVFRTDRFVQTEFSCTVHYGEQFGTERILAFAWYTAGTHVMVYDVDHSTTPSTIGFDEVATFIPTGGWVIQAKPVMRNPANPDEIILYVGDFVRGLDVFTVNLPKAQAAAGLPRVLSNNKGRIAEGGAALPSDLALVLLSLGAGMRRVGRRRAAA